LHPNPRLFISAVLWLSDENESVVIRNKEYNSLDCPENIVNTLALFSVKLNYGARNTRTMSILF
jgi:hypothetical protein